MSSKVEHVIFVGLLNGNCSRRSRDVLESSVVGAICKKITTFRAYDLNSIVIVTLSVTDTMNMLWWFQWIVGHPLAFRKLHRIELYYPTYWRTENCEKGIKIKFIILLINKIIRNIFLPSKNGASNYQLRMIQLDLLRPTHAMINWCYGKAVAPDIICYNESVFSVNYTV